MDPQSNDIEHKSCATCYWFFKAYGGVPRCCNGISRLCGNDDPKQTCEHWSRERPTTRLQNFKEDKQDE